MTSPQVPNTGHNAGRNSGHSSSRKCWRASMPQSWRGGAFGEIARIAGLIFKAIQGKGGATGNCRHPLHYTTTCFKTTIPAIASSSKLNRNCCSRNWISTAWLGSLERMQGQALHVVAVKKPTPLGFPLMAERFREKLGDQPLAARIARMVEELEASAGPDVHGALRQGGKIMSQPLQAPAKKYCRRWH